MSLAVSRRVLRSIAPAAVALLLVLLPATFCWACPGCKDALSANDPDRTRAARGYFWSIIFMFSMPYAILGTVGGYFYWEVRRARNEKARQSEREDPKSLDKEQPRA